MMKLTSDEENTIIKFRTVMKDVLPPERLEDKILLYKFLKARNFNIEQAETMLRKNIRWRKAMQIDFILTDFKPRQDLTKYVSHKLIGFDKEGCPIMYLPLGNIDDLGLLKSANLLNISRYTIKDLEMNCELLKSQSKELGRPVTQTTVIYDMKNLSLSKATHRKSLENVMNLVIILQDNYPEHLKTLFIINASEYFVMAFSIIKTVVASAVLKKVKIFSTVDLRELLKVIDTDVLPYFYGGNCTEAVGNIDYNTMLIGPVPVSYYIVKDFEEMVKKDGTKFIKVEKRSAVEIPLKIQKSRSILHWEFLIRNHDIGFGLMLDTWNEGPVMELIPVHRLETEVEPECGLYRCEEAGDYTIVFDNTYSWFNSKELCYRTWITNDEDD